MQTAKDCNRLKMALLPRLRMHDSTMLLGDDLPELGCNEQTGEMMLLHTAVFSPGMTTYWSCPLSHISWAAPSPVPGPITTLGACQECGKHGFGKRLSHWLA